MSLHIYYERLQYINFLILKRATGNPDTLARKLKLSKVATYKILNEMKEIGFPIAYSKKEKRYYYTEPGKMTNDLFVKEKNDPNEKSGG